MERFRLLFSRHFWVKCSVICWWSIVLGTYLWLLSYVPKVPLFGNWFSVVASTLLGGSGINHITNLYRHPIEKFSFEFAWPPFFVSGGAVVLVCGVLLNALHPDKWSQGIGLIYIVVAMFFIIWGSDTAPHTSGDSNA